MNLMKHLLFALSLLSVVACSHQPDAPDAQWRGIDRNGIFPETQLMDQWPEEGPPLLWVHEGLGKGYASPAVTETQIFINAEQEGLSYVVSLDLEGKQLWRSPNGKEFLGEGFSSTYPGARSTPTVMGSRVYATSGTGRLGCFDVSTGTELWAVDLMEKLDGLLGYFGYSESVAVGRDRVYCFPGGHEHNLAALDRFTGEVVWTAEALRDTFAYGSPILVSLPERKALFFTSRHHILALDPDQGELLSSYPLEGYEYDGEHCNTLVYENGYLYFVANDIPGQGSMRLKIADDGRQIEEVWRNNQVRNNFGGLVVVDNHLFTTIKGNRLVSLDPETGAVSDTLRVGTGSLIFADNKFICYGNNGTINLVDHRPEGMAHAGSFKVREGSGQHFSHPVLAAGIMYIRRGDALMAYDLSEPQ
jgi:outer membrane protein assembly factor BamB